VPRHQLLLFFLLFPLAVVRDQNPHAEHDETRKPAKMTPRQHVALVDHEFLGVLDETQTDDEQHESGKGVVKAADVDPVLGRSVPEKSTYDQQCVRAHDSPVHVVF
jgi:hypothetical protein